ncbi:hypothetical protein TSTA_038420 [Talaromyces stipitatus ATCC 10500]|uniref:Uncharacterized protein n=1 Tax=Talaromyces stipitatus (strain ATCC 10500 / CBS 375.48 / QM 6759 / NRRL 1006) TaxID=441959 RepID=B8M8X3_TALSN|nr:uncharacterized protein TSTA_038420 [Talaromyces stipitatus ATCC 10500]EED20636.1 hypothetical protein TSTA_038420 [Talaromyces stipitatus ATCC 10500]
MGVKTRVRQQALPLAESFNPDDDDDDDDDAVHEGDESSSCFDSDSDHSDDDYESGDGYSTTLIEPDSDTQPCLPVPLAPQQPRDSPSSASKGRRAPAISSELPEYSDDPNDDTDEDLANVPLDYGRARIEERWNKYCGVKVAEHGAPPKWSDPEGALQQAMTNNIHQFFNYCMKLKRGKDSRLLKGIKKGSAVTAEWKSLQGYYRLITRTSFTKVQCEEINTAVAQMPSELIHLLEKLFTWPTSHSLEDKWARRNAATKAVSKYCGVWEGGPLHGRWKQAPPSDNELDQAKSSKRVVRAGLTSDTSASNSSNPLEGAKKQIIRAGEPDAEKPIIYF